MATTTRARTARVPHLCEGCHWTASLRGKATILPGHRYLIHTAFPGAEGFEEGTRPLAHKECVACACERDQTAGLLVADACSAFCCGELPCARPLRHDGNHSCRRCGKPPLPDQPDGIWSDSRDLPDPVKAAERIRNYICATGDGLYDVQGGAPLYGRDLEAVTRAILATAERIAEPYLGGDMGEHCASWHPVVALTVADWLDRGADPYACWDREPMLAIARAYLGGLS